METFTRVQNKRTHTTAHTLPTRCRCAHLADAERLLTDGPHRRAVRKEADRVEADAPPGAQRGGHARRVRRLNPDHFHLRSSTEARGGRDDSA